MPTRSRAFCLTAFRTEKMRFFGLRTAAPPLLRTRPSMQYFPLERLQRTGYSVLRMAVRALWRSLMEERDFFDERPESRTHTMTCPHCGQQGEYELSWLVRRKQPQLGRGADERDRARFAKAQSYMVRRDDLVGCKNVRCRKRFDVAGIQSVAFLQG